MTKYKCGHKCNITILNDSILSMSAWLEWSESVGNQGDKSMCWECYCKENQIEKTN